MPVTEAVSAMKQLSSGQQEKVTAIAEAEQPCHSELGRRADAVIARVDEISTIPQIIAKIIQVVEDPASDAHDLTRVVQGDKSLSARVLRCVNSSAFGLRHKISNLQQAIAYLGMRQIRNLAVTAGVADVFRRNQQIGPYRRQMLWRHSVAVAICARMLALRCGMEQFEDMFLAGLLHDVGILLEDQADHERFRQAIGQLTPSKALATSLPQFEQQALEYDHTLLGTKLAEKWNFPDGVTAAIGYHHNCAGYCGPMVDFVACVEVADLICTLKKITSFSYKFKDTRTGGLKRLDLKKNDILVLAQDLDREMEKDKALFLV